MADNHSLTCVGLTYGRRRIDWPVVAAVPEACATWTSFSLDSMAEAQYCELASCTVFAAGRSGGCPWCSEVKANLKISLKRAHNFLGGCFRIGS